MKESSGFFEEDKDSIKGIDSSDDRYIVGQRIYVSETGFSELYLVRRSGRLFVGKALRPEYRGDNAAEAALRKEFQIGFALDLPGMVRTFDMVSDPEIGSIIVLEYCKGTDLRKFMDSQDSHISGERLEKITHKLISILRSIHDEGIIHRDIKPSNIIYNEINGGVKLIDLGCADAFDQLRFKGSAGTKLYKSEDFKNQPADDWYALSLCLAELAGFCNDKGAKKRVLSSCKTMRRGLSPDAPSKKSSRRWILSLAAVGVLIIGIVSFFLARRDVEMISEDEKISKDSTLQTEGVREINPNDITPALEKTTAADNQTPAESSIVNGDRVKEDRVSEKDHSTEDSGAQQDNNGNATDSQEAIRKRVMEEIIKVGNEVYWEREKKFRAADDISLVGKDPAFYYSRHYALEAKLFDEKDCTNAILSRLIPFPSELPADTVKAMVNEFYLRRFLGHIQRYRVI